MALKLKDIFDALVAGTVTLEDWEGDHKNTKFTDITAKISGVAPINLKFDFKEGGTAKKLEGQRPLVGGGSHVVKLNGTAVSGGRITLQPTVQGIKARLIVKFV